MIDPNDIVDALVDVIRDIPEVVQAMGDDSANISGFHGDWPTQPNSSLAILQTNPPSILVVSRGCYEGQLGSMAANKFPVSIFIRPAEGDSGEAIATKILQGVPSSGDPAGVKFRFLTLHPLCHPITDSPRFQRVPFLVAENTVLEIPELQLVLTENGDN